MIRVGPRRPFGYVSWLPVVINFGYLTYNRWWRHNLCANFAVIYRLRYGRWPLYWYWRKKIEPPPEAYPWHVSNQDRDPASEPKEDV